MPDTQGFMQLLAGAAKDPATASRLRADPRAALASAGVAFPPNVTITAWQNDATTVHLVLPLESAAEREVAQRVNPKVAKLFEQAWRDPAFKSRLMTQPRETFIEVTGATPPPSARFVAHENTPTAFHLVIPAAAASGELSDEDLEQVAGGLSWQTCDDIGTAGALAFIGGIATVGGSVHSVTDVNMTGVEVGAGLTAAGLVVMGASFVVSASH